MCQESLWLDLDILLSALAARLALPSTELLEIVFVDFELYAVSK